MELIISWGTRYLVNFNDQKTKFQLMTLSNIEDDPHSIFKNTIIEPTKTFHILGVTILKFGLNIHLADMVKNLSTKR